MKDDYNLSEIAQKRLEENNLRIAPDNRFGYRFGNDALFSTVSNKDGEIMSN